MFIPVAQVLSIAYGTSDLINRILVETDRIQVETDRKMREGISRKSWREVVMDRYDQQASHKRMEQLSKNKTYFQIKKCH